MPIDPCLEPGVFDPEATTAMGEAFEAACKELYEAGRLPTVRDFIARRIVAAACRGELDPRRLRTAAISWIIVAQMLPVASHEANYSRKQPTHPQHPQRHP
jgi:hypothetical protein